MLRRGRAEAERAGISQRLGRRGRSRSTGPWAMRGYGTSTCRGPRSKSCRPKSISPPSYYEKWLLRLEQLLLERDLVAADELAAGHALRPGKPLPRKLAAADVTAALTRGSYARTPGRPGRASRPASACGPATSIRRPIPACRVMPAAGSEPSSACAAARSSRTRSPSDKGKIRSGSTPVVRRPRIVGRELRSEPESFDRGLRALSGADLMAP